MVHDDSVFLFLPLSAGYWRVVVALPVVGGLDDMAIMREPIEYCCRQNGIVEHARRLGEAQVREDDNVVATLELAQQLEQQSAIGLRVRQKTQLIVLEFECQEYLAITAGTFEQHRLRLVVRVAKNDSLHIGRCPLGCNDIRTNRRHFSCSVSEGI